MRHLHMDKGDVQEMVRAHKADKTLSHKVDLSAVYAVATCTGHGADVLPLVKGQVTPWLGKQIFVIASPGSAEPVLYTPAAASMKRLLFGQN